MTPPRMLDAELPAQTHTSWCSVALHESEGPTCASELVEVGGVTAWLTGTLDAPRVVVDGRAGVLDRDGLDGLLDGLRWLRAELV
jgi:hypothetical protein